MRLPSAVSDQYVYFVGISGSDRFTRQIGMSGKFKVYRSRNGAAAAIYTTPTINETDATNMPGVYELLVDEDVTIDAGDQTQEIAFHITTTDTALSTDSIVPVTRVVELWRSDVTPGTTLLVNSGGDLPGLETATDMLSNIQDVLLPAIETSITYATRGIDQIALGIAAATDGVSLLTSSQVVRESTVGLSGGTTTTVNLDASAHATNDFYKDEIAYISAGSQGGGAVVAGQARLVTAYNGTTKVATIAPPWVVTPSEGNTFVILPSAYLPGMEYATDGISSIQDVLLPAIETSITYATRGIDQILLGLETATDLIFDIN